MRDLLTMIGLSGLATLPAPIALVVALGLAVGVVYVGAGLVLVVRGWRKG